MVSLPTMRRLRRAKQAKGIAAQAKTLREVLSKAAVEVAVGGKLVI